MWTASSYPLSSDGIHNVEHSEFVRRRTAFKGGGDGVNENASVNLGWEVRQSRRMRAGIQISSYVLVLVTCGDLRDGFNLGFVHARWLQVSQ